MSLMKSGRIAMTVLVCIAAAACGKGLSGTYHDQTGQVTLEIKSGSSAHINLMGESHDLTYKVNGNKITFHAVEDSTDASGDVEATVNSDGTLALAMWTLSKSK